MNMKMYFWKNCRNCGENVFDIFSKWMKQIGIIVLLMGLCVGTTTVKTQLTCIPSGIDTGANIAGLLKVANAMLDQGIV